MFCSLVRGDGMSACESSSRGVDRETRMNWLMGEQGTRSNVKRLYTDLIVNTCGFVAVAVIHESSRIERQRAPLRLNE